MSPGERRHSEGSTSVSANPGSPFGPRKFYPATANLLLPRRALVASALSCRMVEPSPLAKRPARRDVVGVVALLSVGSR
jgi:hypothetical protein